MLPEREPYHTREAKANRERCVRSVTLEKRKFEKTERRHEKSSQLFDCSFRLFWTSIITEVMVLGLAPSVSAMEWCSVFLQASAKASRSGLAPSAVFLQVTRSQSVMDVVSRLYTRLCTPQTRCCMPLGLHSTAFYKPGTVFRSLSGISRGHSPDRPMLSCRAEPQRESDTTRGLETIWIGLPPHYLLGM